MVISSNNKSVIDRAISTLHSDDLLILPFDTVYGFLAPADSLKVIKKIYKLKGRSIDKPLGVVIPNINSLDKIAKVSTEMRQFISLKAPGKYTFIVPAQENAGISDRCLKDGKIALRIPNNPLLLSIMEKSGRILAQTSANKAGKPAAAALADIYDQFSISELNQVGLIIDGGEIKDAQASTIYDLTVSPAKIIERK